MSDVVIWDNHSHVEEGERHPKDKTMDEKKQANDEPTPPPPPPPPPLPPTATEPTTLPPTVISSAVISSAPVVVREPHSPLHLRSGPWEGSPGESDAFLRSIICQPWGVLGAGITAEKKLHHDGPDPTEMPSVCICDPAGLHHIQPPGGPKVRGSS